MSAIRRDRFERVNRQGRRTYLYGLDGRCERGRDLPCGAKQVGKTNGVRCRRLEVRGEGDSG